MTEAIRNLIYSLCIIGIHKTEVAQVLYGAIEVRGAFGVGVKGPELSQEGLPFAGVQTRIRVGLQLETPETTHSRSWEEDQQDRDE